MPLTTPTAGRSRTVHCGKRSWWKSLFIIQGCGKLRPEDCELCGKPELQRESLSQTNQVSFWATSKPSTNNHTVCLSAPSPLPSRWSLRSLPTLFCETGSPTGTWALLISLDWLAHEPSTLPVSYSLSLRLAIVNHMPGFSGVQNGPSCLLCKQFANQVYLQHLYLLFTFKKLKRPKVREEKLFS